ncbi:signal transduction histidine kinase [Kitasatospora gansuensis]|uniref:histidine kinase n=1 Tax=Kitasatospora gansuensis TaxID=258050 RepID=A0A7W7WI38_9ACTN|nr:ATP-binding protein [Kitasatospora gansuensis]MBB4947400.1 signal transduction histidine kinase [Kitasatospora gansuensis]
MIEEWGSAVPVLAVAAALWTRRPRPTVVAGAVSLGLTAVGAAGGGFGEGGPAGLFGVVELAGLLALVTVTVRTGRGGVAIAGLAVALLCWPFRYAAPVEGWEQVGLLGFGAVGALAAALIGGYLWSLDGLRHREVAAARRAEQLELAHDLHDFVAHDVSGMVALAQAGGFLAGPHPELAAVLERIEQSGQQALASLDRTVALLRTPDQDTGARRSPQPGIAELPALAERFTASGAATVRLDLPEQPLGREAGATVHRIVVEALTNVRRHAPQARTVLVTLRHSQGKSLELTVADDGGAAEHQPRRRGGHGLSALTARVEALDGTLHAGRTEQGWQVTVTLPSDRTEGQS